MALCCYFFSPGDYEVSIKFNDEHIPDSPFIVPIATLSDDARRLTITSLQVRTGHLNIKKFNKTVSTKPAEATDILKSLYVKPSDVSLAMLKETF